MKSIFKKKSLASQFYWKDYLNITIGLALYSIGLIGFIKPVEIVTGGLAGIALLIEYATKGTIPMYVSILAVNAVLLFFALKILGIKFLIKTIYGVGILSFFLYLAPKILPPEGLVTNEPLMSAIIGAMMCGAGIGFVFNANGSTGGTDIVVAIINKYKNMAFGKAMMLCDFIIICSSLLVFHDFIKIVHGLIVMGVMTYTIDLIINGFRQSVQFFILSSKYEEIADAINSELGRGCTLLDGTGWYSKNPTKVIIVLARRTEGVTIFRIIKSIDDKAFISQSIVRGVYGQGFEQLK